MKGLEKEKAWLKKLVADIPLDNTIPKEARPGQDVPEETGVYITQSETLNIRPFGAGSGSVSIRLVPEPKARLRTRSLQERRAGESNTRCLL